MTTNGKIKCCRSPRILFCDEGSSAFLSSRKSMSSAVGPGNRSSKMMKITAGKSAKAPVMYGTSLIDNCSEDCNQRAIVLTQPDENTNVQANMAPINSVNFRPST